MNMVRKRRRSQSNRISGVVGGTLLGIGCLWLGWLLLAQHGNTPNLSLFPNLPGFPSTPDSDIQVTSLLAEGISLSHSDQTPALNQQQATLIANQLEPEAASKAKSVSAKYVLLNYPAMSTPATHANINNVPVWMVWYQKIPFEPSNASADPALLSDSSHDLYVFIDANSGKEVLSVWV